MKNLFIFLIAWLLAIAGVAENGIAKSNYSKSATDKLGKQSVSAKQATATWAGDASYDWYTADPAAIVFEIYTEADLAGLRDIVNGTATGITATTFQGKTIKLMADLEMNDDNFFTANGDVHTISGGAYNFGAIGNSGDAAALTAGTHGTKYFSGTFDGQFHTIKNLYSNKYSNVGLFGELCAPAGVTVTVRNLFLVNPHIFSDKAGQGAISGIITGEAGGKVRILNCQVINAYIPHWSNTSGTNREGLGSLVGRANSDNDNPTQWRAAAITVENCASANAIVNVNYNGGWSSGMIGNNNTGSGGTLTFKNCYFHGYVGESRCYSSAGTAINCYQCRTNGTPSTEITGLITHTATQMQEANFWQNELYAGFFGVDNGNINAGFPVLVPCAAPSNLAAGVIGPYSAGFSWLGNDFNNDFNVEWGAQSGFTPGAASNSSANTAITTYEITSGLTPSTLYAIAVQNNCGALQSGWTTFNFNTSILCEQPTALTASNNTASSIDIIWNGPINGQGYNIEWGPATFTPGSGDAAGSGNSSTNTYQIGSLNDATAYKIAVQSNCGSSDGTSLWTTINAGTTAIETFGDGIWHGYVYQSPTTDVWQNRFGNYLGYVEEEAQFTKPSTQLAWTGGNANTVWINGSSGPLDYFVVRYKMTYDFVCGNYTITLPNVDDAARLSIDGGQTWLTNLCQGNYCGSAATWEINNDYHNGNYTATVYLSGSTDLVLEFYEKTGGAAVGFQFAIQPLAITMSNLTPSSFDVNAAATEGDAWNIAVTTSSQSDMTNLTDVILPIINTTDNPYSVTELNPETTYYVYAQSDCGGSWGNITVTTPSTCPQPTGLAVSNLGANVATLSWNHLGQTGWNLKISSVPLTNLNTQQGNIENIPVSNNPIYTTSALTAATTYYWYVQSDCGSPWANGTFTTERCDVSEQCTYTLTLTLGQSGYSSDWSGTRIDVKQNGIIAYTTGTMSSENNGTVKTFTLCKGLASEIIVVSAGNYYSNYVRWQLKSSTGAIVAEKASNNTTITGSPQFTIGSDCEPCFNHVLTSSAITETSFNLSFSLGTSWNIKVSTVPLTNPANDVADLENVVATTNNPYTVQGLTAATLYYVYTQRECGAWANTTVTTLTTCLPVTNLVQVGMSTNTTANFSWTAPSGISSFVIEYGTASTFTPGTNTYTNTFTVNDTIVNLSGLTDATAYKFAVRANCGNGYSVWTTINP